MKPEPTVEQIAALEVHGRIDVVLADATKLVIIRYKTAPNSSDLLYPDGAWYRVAVIGTGGDPNWRTVEKHSAKNPKNAHRRAWQLIRKHGGKS